MWREGLGCYKIITENKKGYRNHPAVKEFENASISLWFRLKRIQEEMFDRGYHPKEMPKLSLARGIENPKEWQTYNEQVEILKAKGCKCKV